MTPEERETLRRVAVLAEENNVILKKIIRNNRIATTFWLLYWLIIIGVSVGAYYYIQPYIEKSIPLLDTAITEINSAKNF